eukprot:GILK01004058.1.p1 GENE.GILK01004058.1~~GILK01004058.1.p1  ORF type:complete len:576 (+),score=75.45 GILK01004058.1:36-1763(+)
MATKSLGHAGANAEEEEKSNAEIKNEPAEAPWMAVAWRFLKKGMDLISTASALSGFPETYGVEKKDVYKFLLDNHQDEIYQQLLEQFKTAQVTAHSSQDSSSITTASNFYKTKIKTIGVDQLWFQNKFVAVPAAKPVISGEFDEAAFRVKLVKEIHDAIAEQQKKEKKKQQRKKSKNKNKKNKTTITTSFLRCHDIHDKDRLTDKKKPDLAFTLDCELDATPQNMVVLGELKTKNLDAAAKGQVIDNGLRLLEIQKELRTSLTVFVMNPTKIIFFQIFNREKILESQVYNFSIEGLLGLLSTNVALLGFSPIPEILHNGRAARIESRLGHGASSNAYIAKVGDDDEAVVLKSCHRGDLENEIEVLQLLAENEVNNVPSLLSFRPDYSTLLLSPIGKSITPSNSVHSLQSCLIKMSQIFLTVKHCHEIGIYHRDIRPDNILIVSTGLMLIDFNFSLNLKKQPDLFRYAGTTRFASGAVLEALHNQTQHEFRPVDDLHSLVRVCYAFAMPEKWRSLLSIPRDAYIRIKNHWDVALTKSPWRDMEAVASEGDYDSLEISLQSMIASIINHRNDIGFSA